MQAQSNKKKYIFQQLWVRVGIEVIRRGRGDGVEEDEGKDPSKAIDIKERMAVVLFASELILQISILLREFVVVNVEHACC